MTNVISRADLARWADLSDEAMLSCTTALVHYKDTWGYLSHNTRIPAKTWRTMWGTRPDVELGCALVSRHLDRPERDVILRKEKRSRILTRLISHNELALDEQELLIDLDIEAVTGALLEQPWTDPRIRRDGALAVGGMPLLREMATGELTQFTAAELAAKLTSWNEWAPETSFKTRSQMLQVLLLRRPELVDVAAGSGHDPVVTAAAGVLGISEGSARVIAGLDDATGDDVLAARKFALLALVNNPTVHVELAKEVAAKVSRIPGLHEIGPSVDRRSRRPDVVTSVEEATGPELDWLLHRSLPSDYGPGRLPDMVRLLGNQNLSEADRESLHKGIRVWLSSGDDLHRALAGMLAVDPALDLAEGSHESYADQPPVFVKSFCEKAEQVLGADPHKWDNLVGLMSEYEGSAEDLLSVCAHL